jgi:hypothetical protein
MFPSAFAVVRGSTYSVRCTELWAFQLDCFKVQTYYKYPPCTVVDFSQADKIRVWQLWTSVNIYICKFTKETRARYSTVLHRELNLRWSGAWYSCVFFFFFKDVYDCFLNYFLFKIY